ncbi:hypothetical protein [Bacteroides timonensis]|jgi:hypothetical protein|uniref:hypothetical protein n=1 Tax=Bacteroides timonensis TaxID=1470345 RepID=UPI0005C53BF7|nr:hypothetical protein [Bacteroides timonensis]
MYNTTIFELAMNACSYRLDHIFLKKRSVCKIYGKVPIAKRVTIDGERKTIVRWKKLRWNDAGQCFSMYSSKRQRKYDLPLRSIEEQQKMTKQ